MSCRKSTKLYIHLDNQPYDDILENFEECSISIPLHHQYIPLQIDHNHSDNVNLIRNSLALHVGLSIVENILLRCDFVAYWLKDHFFPKDNVLFEDEIVLATDKQQQILTLLHNVENWPHIIFKDNKKIREMLHTRKSSTNSAYGLYISSEEGNRSIFLNLQLIEQAAKAKKEMQPIYGIFIGIKYLHEFARFIYSKYGRSHLLNTYSIQLKDSVHTPDGVLRGESGNRFEEQMLGFVLLHAGHSNIAMNVKMCVGHSATGDHLRIIGLEFLRKILNKEIYNEMKPVAGPIMGKSLTKALNCVQSLSGLHQGVFGIPYLLKLPAQFRELITKYAYEKSIQDRTSAANCWHDPFQLAHYISHGRFLPHINNQLPTRNETYCNNILKLNAFVMTYSDMDEVVTPRESGWFMGYVNQSLKVETWNTSRQFTDDLIGLRTPSEQGKLHTFTSHARHQDAPHKPNKGVFIKNILPFFNNTLF